MPDYCGRFAPSPSGPLHFGSLVAALGSYLDARHHGGQWRLRIEDLDPPREQPGAADTILRTLEQLGMHWDGEVMYQSRRGPAYEAALETLQAQGLLYPCSCSRREVAALAKPGGRTPVYPGTCRAGLAPGRKARSLRLRVDGRTVAFHDRCQGVLRERLDTQVGDFVLRRADGLIAYQLAVVVDDAEQGVTQVVRGSDLLDSTGRQIYLQECLGYHRPAYLHLPLVTGADGDKLSKQNRAPAIDTADAPALLCRGLRLLGQAPPDELQRANLDVIWSWAIRHWDAERIPPARGIALAEGAGGA